MKKQGITYETLATRINEDIATEDLRVTYADINAMLWRGNGLGYLALTYYLEKLGLLDIEEDLLEIQAITENLRSRY